MNIDELNKNLLRAHEENDLSELVTLYSMAAIIFENRHDIDAACFYFTQAYVFALELDSPKMIGLHQRLTKHGRA